MAGLQVLVVKLWRWRGPLGYFRLPAPSPCPRPITPHPLTPQVVEGMKFDRGYISPYFVTDQKTMKVELENPLILICEKRISG